MSMGAPCPSCDSLIIKEIWVGILKCSDCGFIWAPVSEGSVDYASLYGHGYFFGEEYQDYTAEEQILKVGFRKYERQLRALFPKYPSKPRLLEIGSAYGYFLDIAAEHFDVTGIEINAEARMHCLENGHKMHDGDLFSLEDSNGFDIITSFASLEHIPEPKAILSKVFDLLKPGGYLYLTTIDSGSLLARASGRKWRMIHPPTHVNYFSSASLSDLLRRLGYIDIRVKSVWQYRSLDAALLPKFAKSPLYGLIQKTGINKWPIPFNFGDIIGVLAKKPG
jgi:SAM-dependent methyltransferase